MAVLDILATSQPAASAAGAQQFIIIACDDATNGDNKLRVAAASAPTPWLIHCHCVAALWLDGGTEEGFRCWWATVPKFS
jgi:hypothetical protein